MTTRADEQTTCAVCGEAITTTDWHPAAAESTRGEVHVHAFCSDKCRTKWLAQSAPNEQ